MIDGAPRPRAIARAGEEDRSVLRRRLLWLMAGRLVVASLLLGGTLLVAADESGGFSTFTPRLLLGLIVATYAASVAFALWLPRAERVERVAALQIGWDLLLTSGVVYAVGGVSSGFAFLYGVIILAAALVVGPRATSIAGATAIGLYTALGLGVGLGALPGPPDQPLANVRVADAELGFALLRNIVGLLLVTLLAGNLASRLRRAGGQLREAEASARKLARLHEDIVRSVHSGLITTDAEGRIVTVNPAALELLRTTEAALVGKSVSAYLPAVEPAPDAATGPSEARSEGIARRPDGSSFPVGHSRTPLVEAEGTEIGTVVAFQDLTEINELRRTAEHAERLAAMGRLAAALAHEIRNPLGSISGSVELVRDSPELGEEDRQLLGIVLTEVERLDDLVTTMLEVGRPKPPQRGPVDVPQLVDEVVRVAARGPAVTHAVTIESEAPPEGAQAWADAAQLRQVLWNLLKNAIQATPRGGRVRVRVLVDADRKTVIEVRDEGSGIDPRDRPRMFDMFYSARAHGVGLGLALVKQIVDAHGGSVQVSNDAGSGAVFRVSLPSEEPADARTSAEPTEVRG